MKEIPSEAERKTIYSTLVGKDMRVREEHAMKDEHKENFRLGKEGISLLCDKVF